MEHLQDRHRVKRRGCLSSRWIGSSSKSWNHPTRFGRWAGFAFQPMALADRDAQPLTHPREAGGRILFLPRCRPRWGQKKTGQVGCTPRIGDLVVDLWEEWRSSMTRGLAAPLARTIHPGGYGMVPLGRPFQTQFLHSVSQEKFGVHAWAGCVGQNARGRGHGTRPTAPPHLKPPMTGCRPSRHHSFHRMRPDRLQPQRDGSPGGWRERVKTLCGERVRYAGVQPA